MTTILQDLEEYLSYKESYLRPDSYKVYRNSGANFKAFLLEKGWSDLPAKKFTPVMCEQYRIHLLKQYQDPTTRNKEIAQFKSFFYQLTDPGWAKIKESPAKHLKLVPKVESVLHEPYTEQQVADIFGKVIEKQDYYLLLYIYMIHYTFSRPGKEVRLLKVGDIKPRAIVIKPENSKTRRIKTPTIPKPLEELINALGVRNYASHFYVFGSEGTPGAIPVGKGCFYYRHKKILNELGIVGKYTLYGWKHTGNIRAVGLGINERTLQIQNGFTEHRTMEIYLRRLSAYASNEIYDKFV